MMSSHLEEKRAALLGLAPKSRYFNYYYHYLLILPTFPSLNVVMDFIPINPDDLVSFPIFEIINNNTLPHHDNIIFIIIR